VFIHTVNKCKYNLKVLIVYPWMSHLEHLVFCSSYCMAEKFGGHYIGQIGCFGVLAIQRQIRQIAKLKALQKFPATRYMIAAVANRLL